MPALQSLSEDMKKALGKDLSASYAKLQAKEAIKDDKEAQDYVTAVVKRFETISKAATGAGHAETKAKYLQTLKEHGSMMAVRSHSKPEDVSNVLKNLGHDADAIQKIVKSMEQAGATDDDVCCVITSVAVCETSSALLGGGGHHHHGHHHHHHRHW